MSDVDEVIRTVDSVRGIATWDPSALSAALGVAVRRATGQDRNEKLYEGPILKGPFTRVRMERPVQSGPGRWSVWLGISENINIRIVDLKSRLPNVKFTPQPPPTPGYKGPPVWVTSGVTTYPECTAVFTLKAVGDVSTERLVRVVLWRPPALEAPDHYAPQHFRAYRVSEGSAEHFVIERASTHSQVLQVTKLALSERTLHVDFVIDDIALGDDAAQVLIKSLLLEGMLKDRFAGKVDQVLYADTEIPAIPTAPWPY
jgi:hypothetical protein